VGVALAGAVGWLIVMILNAIAESVIRLRESWASSIDAQLVRIVTRLLAILILVYVAVYLAESFGIPAAPLIASLGVGGLAIGLAVRPTPKDVIGGFIQGQPPQPGAG
jgi:MscS family membrane protein